MKKKIILGASLLLTIVGAAFATAAYKTSCGKVVMSVDERFFDGNDNEYQEFLLELNEVHCGTKEEPIVINRNY